jgi:PTS system nitrogen regulatory IIA component
VQLTIRDAAKLLRVNENAVYRWINEQGLPAEQISGHYRFNRAELLEWATIRKINFSPDLIESAGNGNKPPELHDALLFGGVYYHLPGTDKESVLRAAVQRMPLPPTLDPDFLTQVLLSRESQGGTGIGDGLALPHPRYPVVLPVQRPFITLCFLEQPVPYAGLNTPNPQLVHTLFALVCPTVRFHLSLLARLAHALQEPAFRDPIKKQAPVEQIMDQARRLDEALRAGAGEGAGK